MDKQAQRDQWIASMKDQAEEIAFYYHKLIECGVPEAVAGELAKEQMKGMFQLTIATSTNPLAGLFKRKEEE